jgi:predicted nucleotidyltransferase
MRRAELISRLKETEPTLRAFGVGGLYLFGSYARDEAQNTSDVDVFVEPTPGRSFGLIPFMDTYEALKRAVGENIDYGTRNGLHPLLRAEIEREAVRIF